MFVCLFSVVVVLCVFFVLFCFVLFSCFFFFLCVLFLLLMAVLLLHLIVQTSRFKAGLHERLFLPVCVAHGHSVVTFNCPNV